MSLYSVNLAKGDLPNAAERKKRYLAMVAYFALCGVLLIESGFWVMKRHVIAQDAAAETAGLKRDFLKKHPGESGMKEYAAGLNAKLNLQKSRIISLKKEFPVEQPLAQALFYLMKDVPASGELLSFQYDESLQQVILSCRLIQGEGPSLSPTQMLQRWRTNKELFKYVDSIVLLDLEENLFVQGRPAVNMNCRLKLKPVEG